MFLWYLLDFGRNVLGIKYQDEMKFNCLIFNHKYILIKTYLKIYFLIQIPDNQIVMSHSLLNNQHLLCAEIFTRLDRIIINPRRITMTVKSDAVCAGLFFLIIY